MVGPIFWPQEEPFKKKFLLFGFRNNDQNIIFSVNMNSADKCKFAGFGRIC